MGKIRRVQLFCDLAREFMFPCQESLEYLLEACKLLHEAIHEQEDFLAERKKEEGEKALHC